MLSLVVVAIARNLFSTLALKLQTLTLKLVPPPELQHRRSAAACEGAQPVPLFVGNDNK